MKRIAGLSLEEWRLIRSSKTAPEEKKRLEERVDCFLEENPEDLEALFVVVGFTDNPFVRNSYLNRMIHVAKRKGDYLSYTLAIIISGTNNRQDLARDLFVNMSKKYPVRSRVIYFVSKVMAATTPQSRDSLYNSFFRD